MDEGVREGINKNVSRLHPGTDVTPPTRLPSHRISPCRYFPILISRYTPYLYLSSNH